MSKHDQGYQALTAAGSDDTTIGWSIPAGDREGFGRKPKPALIAPIRRYSHSFTLVPIQTDSRSRPRTRTLDGS
jgi:hypothetical protein